MQIFMEFIVPVLILIGVAAVLAFLLAYLGKKLTVTRDPRIDDVVSKLSGANCGGCGYAGCDAFATALVEGKAELSACNPTAKANKDKIAVMLGLSNDGEETVAIVHCIGGNNCRDKFDYQGYGTCVTAELLAGGSKACPSGCMGKGTCSSVCPVAAIKEGDAGYAEVDPKKCISCGACVSNCPKRIISRIPRSARVYVACSNHGKGKEVMDVCKKGCIACGICQKSCPSGAITLVDGIPVFDYQKCTGCLVCVLKCPRKVIVDRFPERAQGKS